MSLIARIRNEIDFALRKMFRWRRPIALPKADPGRELFSHLKGDELSKARDLAARLEEQYQLAEFRKKTSPGNYRENLFYLHMLEQCFDHFGQDLPDPCSVLDVGVSHWFYAQALIHFLRYYRKTTPRSFSLDGYEIDAYRVYSDLHSRFDHAQVNIAGESEVHFHPEGYAHGITQYDLAFQFFPFIFMKDHRDWGIPDRLFDPARLLHEVITSIKPGGLLCVVNQGLDESKVQKQMMEAAGLIVSGPLEIDPLLFRYDFLRYVLVGKKHDD